MSNFTWSPAPGASENNKPTVLKAPFGDGYQQRARKGIHSLSRVWRVTFNRRESPITAIDAFLRARGGVESFDWVPPLGPAGKWICEEWDRDAVLLKFNSLSATFTEVFGD